MYVKLSHNDGIVLLEYRLCCECTRMFCLNSNDYLLFTRSGMVLYKHYNCPPLDHGFHTTYTLEK